MAWTYFQELVETPSHSKITLEQSPIVSGTRTSENGVRDPDGFNIGG